MNNIRKRTPRLRTAVDVRAFLARVIRETYRGDLNPKTAAKLGYLLNILLNTIETTEIETALRLLEERVEQQEQWADRR